MATAKLNQALGSLSGKLDGWVYRQVKGKTVVAGAPNPEVPAEPSQAQLAQRKRFTAAQAYMKQVLADPCQREAYEAMARALGRRADKLVAGDFLNPPVVDRIDLSGYHGQPGDLIRVLATDDVEVVSVEVVLKTAAGAVLERGPATKLHGVWRYAATLPAPAGQRITIHATAKDRPGHDGRGEVPYS